MFEIPCLIPMIITATRMHRYLVDFASKPADLYVISSLFLSQPLSGTDVILGNIRTPK
jgi:hypothetical protein